MNILVLGGTRYMGKHIVKELLAKNYFVTIGTRGVTADDFGNQVNRLIIDRTDKNSLAQTIPNRVYDVIIDSLAYCSNDVKYLLDSVKCKKYIQISSASVYDELHSNTKENEFDAYRKAIVYCNRTDFPYYEIKRQAECAIVQAYSHIHSVRIRFPFVIGEDDYTKRLYFYIEHIIQQQPMFVDNLNANMAFVRSDEAGKFVVSFVENDFVGAINGASAETISVKDIISYVEFKTGKEAVLADDGDPAPYNGTGDYYLDICKATALGFSFSPLESWIYKLIDYYIANIRL